VLHRQLLAVVRDDAVCHRLMTVPGVGPVVALTFRATVEVPSRLGAADGRRHAPYVGRRHRVPLDKLCRGRMGGLRREGSRPRISADLVAILPILGRVNKMQRRLKKCEAICPPSHANRCQLAAYAGLAPSPWKSGSIDREQGISKSGSPRLRTTMVELAWLWLRYQPGSALRAWFRERAGGTAIEAGSTTWLSIPFDSSRR
jgi:transposase